MYLHDNSNINSLSLIYLTKKIDRKNLGMEYVIARMTFQVHRNADSQLWSIYD